MGLERANTKEANREDDAMKRVAVGWVFLLFYPIAVMAPLRVQKLRRAHPTEYFG